MSLTCLQLLFDDVISLFVQARHPAMALFNSRSSRCQKKIYLDWIRCFRMLKMVVAAAAEVVQGNGRPARILTEASVQGTRVDHRD